MALQRVAAVATTSTPEEENIIRKRYVTSTAVGSGEPPFSKLTRRYLELCRAVSSGGSAGDAHRQLVRELAGVEALGARLTVVSEANQREQAAYQAQLADLAAAQQQALDDIAARKVDLAAARVVRAHNEQYEALRRQVMQHPRRPDTQAEIDKLQADIAAIQADSVRIAETTELRRAQFGVLFQTIADLQRTLAAEAQADGDAEPGALPSPAGAAAGGGGGAQPMQTG